MPRKLRTPEEREGSRRWNAGFEEGRRAQKLQSANRDSLIAAACGLANEGFTHVEVDGKAVSIAEVLLQKLRQG